MFIKNKKSLIFAVSMGLLILGACGQKTEAQHVHVDKDNDFVCDSCQDSVAVNVDFYVLNDLHGRLLDGNGQPGTDEMTTYLKSMQMSDDNTVLIASGDMWAGSSESNMTHGAIMTDWMNELGFVSMTLGNHEFDWGESVIQENLKLANFPFLALNIFDKATNQPVDYCKPSVLIERSGVKIGIIGAIGDCYSSISQDKVTGIYFKTGSELTALIRAEAEKLKNEGAQFIILSIHDGSSRGGSGVIRDSELSSYLEPEVSNLVDISVEAHTHKEYVYTDKNGVYHIQCGGENSYGLTHIDVDINPLNNTSRIVEATNVPHSTYISWGGDSLIASLSQKYEATIGKANEVIFDNPKYRSGDTLRQLVADLYYKKGVEKWGDKYDIVLGGGYISIRGSKSLESGEVIYSDIQTLFPFDNQIVLCSVKGVDLNNNFFATDNNNYYLAWETYGESVRKKLDPTATYYIVTDTYSSSYAKNNLTVIDELGPDIFARDLLAEYFRTNPGKSSNK